VQRRLQVHIVRLVKRDSRQLFAQLQLLLLQLETML
jgi:hypothetical protein